MPALEGARAQVSGWAPGVRRQNRVIAGRPARLPRASQGAVRAARTAGIAVREGRLLDIVTAPPGARRGAPGGDWQLVQPGEARITGHPAAPEARPEARDAVGAAFG